MSNQKKIILQYQNKIHSVIRLIDLCWYQSESYKRRLFVFQFFFSFHQNKLA